MKWSHYTSSHPKVRPTLCRIINITKGALVSSFFLEWSHLNISPTELKAKTSLKCIKGHDKPSTALQESSPEAQFVGTRTSKFHGENDVANGTYFAKRNHAKL